MTIDMSDVRPDQVIFGVLTNWLRKPLQVSVETFKRGALSIVEEPEPRDYFLYGVLETLERVGYTLLILQEDVARVDIEKLKQDLIAAEDSVDKKHARYFVQHFINAELLCMRQLLELFVDVLCFGATNEHSYYKQYMLTKGLEQAERLAGDWRTFFNCENRMISSVVSHLGDAVSSRPAGYDDTKGWFTGKSGKPTSVFARFRRAIACATDEERVCLGFSYNMSYGHSSRAVHAGLGAIGASEPQFEAIDGYQRVVERLGLHLLWRISELRGLQGSSDDHRDIMSVLLSLPRYSTEGNHPEFATAVAVGDLVCTPFYFGVISQIQTNAYGNRACLVQPITAEELHSGDSDWWPSLNLRPFLSTDDVVKKARKIAPELPEQASDLQRTELAVIVAQAILRERAGSEH
jgi:hypothetical protein